MNTTTQILEGPRIEPAMLNKMDTSLEQDLVGISPNARSNFSPCSASPNVLHTDRGCRHNKLVSQENYDACFHCGAYVPKNGVRVYKSTNKNYQPFFSPKEIYETMTRRSEKFDQSANSEYAKMRLTYVEWILELADKFKISHTSTHLAVQLLDFIMFKDPSLTQKLQLFAPVCLLVAAKTIELDERIPYIPRLRRYANPTFSVEDYRKAELRVLDMVDWNPQFSPAYEITEFLLCQGVLFSTDEVIEECHASPQGIRWSPEVLREKNQHENVSPLEGKTDVKKSPAKEASHDAKENNENSYSDHSTNGTTTDQGTPLVENVLEHLPQEEEPFSPLAAAAVLMKRNSTPANFENYATVASSTKVPIERKIEEILVNFEISYAKISTLLVKDNDFIEYEPKVVSAATITFLRHLNKISSLWNPELEAITQLKFAQVSSCFELINKKYNTAFNSSAPKLQPALHAPDMNRDILPEVKLFKVNAVASDKPVSTTQPKVELCQKINLASVSHKPANLVEQDPNIAENKPVDRKPVQSFQTKTNIPAASTTATAYNYLRDDLRYRTKYANGTINTELPRNPLKNPIYPPGYPKFNAGLDHLGAYHHNPSVTVSGSTGVAQYSLPSENYLRSDVLAAKNPTGTLLPNRSTASFENGPYQPKVGAIKK